MKVLPKNKGGNLMYIGPSVRKSLNWIAVLNKDGEIVYQNRLRKKKGWIVKVQRPEELYSSPNEFYTREEVEKYARSSHMRRTQRKITLRILELLNAQPPARVLDMGCGVGYSTEVLIELGYKAIGIDINPFMLEIAKKKGLEVFNCDMRNLSKYFKKSDFDYVISASTLQWIKEMSEIKKISKEIYYILKNNGGLGIQFYPYSERELYSIFWKFKRTGFEGKIVIDNPQAPRKRTIYMIMNKI